MPEEASLSPQATSPPLLSFLPTGISGALFRLSPPPVFLREDRVEGIRGDRLPSPRCTAPLNLDVRAQEGDTPLPPGQFFAVPADPGGELQPLRTPAARACCRPPGPGGPIHPSSGLPPVRGLPGDLPPQEGSLSRQADTLLQALEKELEAMEQVHPIRTRQLSSLTTLQLEILRPLALMRPCPRAIPPSVPRASSPLPPAGTP